MERAYAMTEDTVSFISDWRYKRAAQTKANEARYSEERAELKRQRQQLEYERQEFLREKAFEEKRLEKEKRIFDAEWKMLEDGWRNLASEKEELARYHTSDDDGDFTFAFSDCPPSMLFSGVRNVRALKKRYRELIKIFHPDNGAGDAQVLHMINQEYEEIKKSMETPKSRIFQG